MIELVLWGIRFIHIFEFVTHDVDRALASDPINEECDLTIRSH